MSEEKNAVIENTEVVENTETVDTVTSEEKPKKEKPPKKKKGFVKALAVITVTVIIALSVLVGYPVYKEKMAVKEDKETAAHVEALINTLEKKDINLITENELTIIKLEYDALTKRQKKFVNNYNELEDAFERVNEKKGLKAVDDLIAEINKINKDTLTAENTNVAELLEIYNGFTNEQKELVTNIDLLNEYNEIVMQKVQAAKQKEKGLELAENFEGFEGKWGNFGVHVNEYQGMIEAAIKEKLYFQKYFYGAPDNLDMRVTRFEKDGTVFGIGICYVSFTGIPKESYDYSERTIYGEVVIKEDGTLFYNMNGYY